MERILIGESEYRLAEESGYQLDTVVQLRPSQRSITVFSSPCEEDPAAW